MLQKIIFAFESQPDKARLKQDFVDSFKNNFTLLDALRVVKTAWVFCTATTIENCFRHAGFKAEYTHGGACSETEVSDCDTGACNPDPEYTDTFDRAAAVMAVDMTADDFVTIDSCVATTADLTATDLIASMQSQEEESGGDDEPSDLPPSQPPTPALALAAMETVTQFLMSHENTPDLLVHAEKMEHFIRQTVVCEKKQATITDFFKKWMLFV